MDLLSLDIVILPNGAPVEAPAGSADRVLIDWLSAPGSDKCRLDLYGPWTDGGSMASAYRRRLESLARILGAHDKIDVEVGTFSSRGDSAKAISTRRQAEQVFETLRGAGVEHPRLLSDIPNGASADGSPCRLLRERGSGDGIALLITRPG